MIRQNMWGRFYDRIVHDRILTAILTAYFTVTLILIMLAGLTIWPVILTLMNSDAAVAPFCAAVFKANLPLLVVYFVVAGVFMFFERSFSFGKTMLINVGIGGFVNLIVLIMQRYSLAGMDLPNVMLSLLWFIISFFLSWILAILPSMLIGGLAKLIHIIFFKIYEWRH